MYNNQYVGMFQLPEYELEFWYDRMKISIVEYDRLQPEQRRQFQWLRDNAHAMRVLHVDVLKNHYVVNDATNIFAHPELATRNDRIHVCWLIDRLQNMSKFKIDSIVYFVDSVLTDVENERVAHDVHRGLTEKINLLTLD